MNKTFTAHCDNFGLESSIKTSVKIIREGDAQDENDASAETVVTPGQCHECHAPAPVMMSRCHDDPRDDQIMIGDGGVTGLGPDQ